jgi:hypothetical protein
MVPKPASKHGPEFHRPAPNGLVGHIEPTFRQQAFHITIAQREPEIESDGVLDDSGRELVAGVRNR